MTVIIIKIVMIIKVIIIMIVMIIKVIIIMMVILFFDRDINNKTTTTTPTGC